MHARIEQTCRTTLRAGFRVNLETTREQYNQLGAGVCLGVGLIGLTALWSTPAYPLKGLLYACSLYCLLIPSAYYPGFYRLPLPLAIMQVPLGVLMILGVQQVVPAGMLYLAGFLYPILFVFAFAFHSRAYTSGLFVLACSATVWIVLARGIPHALAYLVTSFGAALTMGLVVRLVSGRAEDLLSNDPLTGLMNRRHWQILVGQMLAQSQRDETPLVVVFFDLDRFKRLTERQGRSRGDQVLRRVADSMRDVSRQADALARWADDEFVIALPNTSAQQAAALMNRLTVQLGGVGVAAGLVEWRPGESFEQLLQRAEQAMSRVRHGAAGTDGAPGPDSE